MTELLLMNCSDISEADVASVEAVLFTQGDTVLLADYENPSGTVGVKIKRCVGVTRILF